VSGVSECTAIAIDSDDIYLQIYCAVPCVHIVQDQGRGMDQASVRSLGLTPVESLAQQLRATLDISTGHGTRVTLTLPAVAGVPCASRR
jgi:two-component sensor histidine kinase